jgi:hypothetical protein
MLMQLWCMTCWGVKTCISVDKYQSLGRMLSLHLGGVRVNRQNSGADNYDPVRGVMYLKCLFVISKHRCKTCLISIIMITDLNFIITIRHTI